MQVYGLLNASQLLILLGGAQELWDLLNGLARCLAGCYAPPVAHLVLLALESDATQPELSQLLVQSRHSLHSLLVHLHNPMVVGGVGPKGALLAASHLCTLAQRWVDGGAALCGGGESIEQLLDALCGTAGGDQLLARGLLANYLHQVSPMELGSFGSFQGDAEQGNHRSPCDIGRCLAAAKGLVSFLSRWCSQHLIRLVAGAYLSCHPLSLSAPPPPPTPGGCECDRHFSKVL